ncbi:MAG: (d)CMP kinase, partial [Candidatus Tectomicrobia bacterium]|nr:(d)CMP kinase [Candidatus Tectomicrobia bacterium]
PAGSGKSTMAKAMADHFGLDYLETGALYRAVGLMVLDRGGDPDDTELAARCAREMRFECRKTPQGWRNFLDGRDVTQALREERVSDAASRVSAFPPVRQALLSFQRSYKERRGAVVDGRDIGTMVFPEARLKFFLDADIEVRIQRRFRELRERGIPFDEVRLGGAIRARDRRDRERAAAPLLAAPDAVRVDTSDRSIDQVLASMLEKVRQVYGEVIEAP